MGLGTALGKSGLVHSMMDISDGISKDLKTLCKASGVGASLILDDFCVSPDLEKYCESEKKDIYNYLLSNFEDYSLLMTCDEESAKEVMEIISSFGFVPSCIGKITEDNNIKVILKGKDFEMPKTWEHF